MWETGAVSTAFPNSTSGCVEQWELAVEGDSARAGSVRLWDAGSAVEGCYADETTGRLSLGEEEVGVWVYGAEPDAGTAGTLLDSTGPGGHFTVYDRTGRAYLGRFSVTGGRAADGCEDTDGIDATAAGLGPTSGTAGRTEGSR
ncbi:phytase [Streptomyces sp. NPDC085612]|uniref:phytase n=1 Tax=Streptomyces sp. NPDC085612 TaxID=3365732 RepID=UPI0037CCE944